jgi:2-polyprenyl-3-methyl-5-hydroxy-6-metoxy-1,4-benzoquinol methylase
MANKLARAVDSLLIRHLGLRYALLTRDWMIHERMRFLVDWIDHEPGPIRVLDAGCGSGLALLYLHWYQQNKIRSYLGLDLDTRKLRTRYQFVEIPHSFENIDLDSSWQFGAFDLVFCSEVLEHLCADSRLFSRLCCHLSEDGTLLITTPHKEFVRRNAADFPGFDAVRLTQDGGHVRMGYVPSELEQMANANGLAAVGKVWLGEIDHKELSGREAKRKQGDYPNMTRYNLRWIRRMNSSEPRESDRCWTLAMAFRRTSAKASREPLSARA